MVMTLASPDLLCDRDGGVCVIRLNRPGVRNALGRELIRHLGAALAMAEADPDIRAVVLTGAPPGFCAGSDLKELARMPAAAGVRHEAAAGQAVLAIPKRTIPVVAAVEGFALGGGFLLATGCDLVVTGADARWHLPEVGLGWLAPWGLQTLIARVGPVTARRLTWADIPLDGRQAHALGIADELAEPGGALALAFTVASRLASLPANAVASAKRVFADLADDAEELDARAIAMFGDDFASGTACASLAAFAGNRAGNRRGQ